jgi:RNA polymerase sigma-70 factor (family 1)
LKFNVLYFSFDLTSCLPAMNVNEKNILQKLANGDETALAEMYREYWQSLFISAYNIIKDKEACSDILQDIFLQLWVRREKLEITSSLEAYLHTAVRYHVFKHIRKSTYVNRYFENLELRFSAASADEEIMLKQLNEQVAHAVQSLPKQCMLIFKLSREEHLSNREIAEQLNISVKTVENQMTIALRRLRLSLNDAAFGTLLIAGFFVRP